MRARSATTGADVMAARIREAAADAYHFMEALMKSLNRVAIALAAARC
ncbi:hypothetical protein [Nonomuraea phyllanthi]|nr:hypothetical protein [Nonomuraea phyllanthi]